MGFLSKFRRASSRELMTEALGSLQSIVDEQTAAANAAILPAARRVKEIALSSAQKGNHQDFVTCLSDDLTFVDCLASLRIYGGSIAQIALELLFAAVHPDPAVAISSLADIGDTCVASVALDTFLPSSNGTQILSATLRVGTHIVVRLNWFDILSQENSFKDTSRIHQLSIAIVAVLFAHVPTAQTQLKASGTLEALILDTVSKCEIIQVAALGAIASCATEPSNRQLLIQSGTIPCTISLIYRRRATDDVVFMCTFFLAQVVNDAHGASEIAKYFLPDGTSGFEVIVKLLEYVAKYLQLFARYQPTTRNENRKDHKVSCWDSLRQLVDRSISGTSSRMDYPELSSVVWNSTNHLLHIICVIFRDNQQRSRLLDITLTTNAVTKLRVNRTKEIERANIVDVVASLHESLSTISVVEQKQLCLCACALTIIHQCFEPNVLVKYVAIGMDLFSVSHTLLFRFGMIRKLLQVLFLPPNTLARYQAYTAKVTMNYARIISTKQWLFQDGGLIDYNTNGVIAAQITHEPCKLQPLDTNVGEGCFKREKLCTRVGEHSAALFASGFLLLLSSQIPRSDMSPHTKLIVLHEYLGAAAYLALHVEYVVSWLTVSWDVFEALLSVCENAIAILSGKITTNVMITSGEPTPESLEMQIALLRRSLSVIGNILSHFDEFLFRIEHKTDSFGTASKRGVIRRLHNLLVIGSTLEHNIRKKFRALLSPLTREISSETRLTRLLLELHFDSISWTSSRTKACANSHKQQPIQLGVQLNHAHVSLKRPLSEHMQTHALQVMFQLFNRFGWTQFWPPPVTKHRWGWDNDILRSVFHTLIDSTTPNLQHGTLRTTALEREALRVLIALTQPQKEHLAAAMCVHLKFASDQCLARNSAGIRMATVQPSSSKPSPHCRSSEEPFALAICSEHGRALHLPQLIARNGQGLLNPHQFPDTTVSLNHAWGAMFRGDACIVISHYIQGTVNPESHSMQSWSVSFWIRSMWSELPVGMGHKPGSRKYTQDLQDELVFDVADYHTAEGSAHTIAEFGNGNQIALKGGKLGACNLGIIVSNNVSRNGQHGTGIWIDSGTDMSTISRGWHRVCVTSDKSLDKTIIFVDGSVSTNAAGRYIPCDYIVSVGNSLLSQFSTPLGARWCVADFRCFTDAIPHAKVTESIARSSFNRRPWDVAEEFMVAHEFARSKLLGDSNNTLTRRMTAVIGQLKHQDPIVRNLAASLLCNLTLQTPGLALKFPNMVTDMMDAGIFSVLTKVLLANLLSNNN